MKAYTAMEDSLHVRFVFLPHGLPATGLPTFYAKYRLFRLRFGDLGTIANRRWTNDVAIRRTTCFVALRCRGGRQGGL
jgi:hypothetical protein